MPASAPTKSGTPYDLEEAAGSEAVELLLQRGRQVGSRIELTEATVEPIVEICRRLDGIPLAIEMAASRLKVLPVAEVARRMDDRFRLLKSGTRGELPQHRTLRALIDWSYEQLEPEEQTLLNRLSVFAAGWTLESAEDVAVGGIVKDWDVLNLISRLLDKSLIESDAGATDGAARFRMLETVRSYANEQLEESGESMAVRERHRDYFAALSARAEAEFVGPDQAEWHSRLAAEHEELRRAFETCREPDADPLVGLQMAGSLFRYWMVRGHWSEADGWSREVLERAQGLPPSPHRAKTSNCLGAIELHRGNIEEARRHWQGALDEWTLLDNEKGMVAARMNLGNVAFIAGDYETAHRDFSASLEGNRKLDLSDGIARCLISLGNTALVTGKYEDSQKYNAEAIERLREQGHAELVSHALLGLGTTELRLGNYEAALRNYEESLSMQRDLGDIRATALGTHNLAVALHKLGRNVEAHANFMDAVAVFEKLGDVTGICAVLDGLAVFALDLGLPEHAALLYGAVNQNRETLHLPRMPAEETAANDGIERARTHLGADRMESLRAVGAEMDLNTAIGWARENIVGPQ